MSRLRCTKVCSHTTDNHSWHTWLVTSTMHEGVFSYNRQITADTPELSPLRCTKVCFSYNRQSQLTHLTCHLYDARMCVLIQQTITVDTPDLSPLRCTKVCFHTTDNHSWYTWLVTSMMHERVFSYNRQITADTPDLSRLWCTRCALIQQINVKKLQFIHKLTASDTSKTADITKRWYYPPAHRLNVNVLLSNITFFVIFAVSDVSLTVNLCINCSFFTFIFVVLLHFWVITANLPFWIAFTNHSS